MRKKYITKMLVKKLKNCAESQNLKYISAGKKEPDWFASVCSINK